MALETVWKRSKNKTSQLEQEENWCETGNPTRRMARTGNGMEGGREKEAVGTWKL